MTIETAQELGKQAFLNGLKCAPALDKEFIKSMPAQLGSAVALSHAWIRGWTLENLKD